MEAQNCCSDRRETGTQTGKTENHIAYLIRSPDSVFDEKRKPNAEKRKIRKPRKTPQLNNRFFFFLRPKPQNLKTQSPPRWDYHSYDYLKNTLCHHEDFYKRSPLQSSRRFNTWYISERVLVFPCKMEKMFLFLCFYSTLWRNLIEKISEPQFKRCLIFFSSNIYIFIAPGK